MAENASTAAHPRRVLVVEDNADAAQMLVALLRDVGHEATHAPDGAAALEIARSFRPEFVLLDLGLPGMGGYEVCARLKQERGLEGVRVIALTAYDRDEHRAGTRAVGCEQHLVKPVSPQRIFDLLESPPPAGDATPGSR